MQRLTAENVATGLRRHRGNISAVAKSCGVARTTVADYVARRPALQAVARECRESMKDVGENALYKAVEAGEPWAVQFFLRTQAFDRGYTERSVVDHTGAVLVLVEEIVPPPLVVPAAEPSANGHPPD